MVFMTLYFILSSFKDRFTISFDKNILINYSNKLGMVAFNEHIHRENHGAVQGERSQLTNLELALEDDECLKQLKSNYTMLNGFFLEKNVSRKDLPEDFEYLINPKHTCFDIVTRKDSSDPLTPKNKTVPKDIFIIIIIHTAPDHINLRESIRETWGSVREYYNYNIRLVFMLGIPKIDSIQQQITIESTNYGDVVQAWFLDDYVNMTYKMSMGFKWISYYCSHAKFVLKMDDDIFADIFQVIDTLRYFDKRYGAFLMNNVDKIRPKELSLPYTYNQTSVMPIESFGNIIDCLRLSEKLADQAATPPVPNKVMINQSNAQGVANCDQKSYTMIKVDPNISAEFSKLFGDEKLIRDIIICPLRINSPIVRVHGFKWYATEKEYPGNYYEPYCSGWVMILTPPTAYKLHKAYFTQPYFFVDDVHVTGRLARMTGTLMIDMNSAIHLEGNFDNWIKEEQFNFTDHQRSNIKYVFCNNVGDRQKIRSYWNKTLIGHNPYGQFLAKK
ncbi:unnamed protein product [Gordionus sp. m RMFG-2023]